jgi:predicted NBD/HSP70 family sugar kinase
MNNDFYIAIDIGGTHVRIASFSSLTNPVFKNTKIFELSHVFDNDFKQIVETIHAIEPNKITAIGVGIPGVLNENKDSLVFATNIPEWININLKERLSEEFYCNVYLDNDAVTSGLGEALYGKTGLENFIFIIWGTGVGGAVVEIVPKLKGIKIQKSDYIEEIRYKSYAKHLVEKYGKPLSELESKTWEEIISDFEKLLIHVSNKFNIKNIVIGGGVALKQKERMITLSEKLKKNNMIHFQTATLGNDQTFGLYGAAALISQNNSSL